MLLSLLQVLLPCGHIMDKDAAVKHHSCAFCRNRIASASRLVALNPLITLLERSATGAWSATVVDAARKPLEERGMYPQALC